MRVLFVAFVMSLLVAQASHAGAAGAALEAFDETDQKPSQTFALEGDAHIAEWTNWNDGHYRIRGNVIFERGGVLAAEDSVIELTGRYSNEFKYFWNGGTLITRNTTIGGTLNDDVIAQAGFELRDGEWYSEDTTVRYTYGIVFGGRRGDKVAKFRATRLKQGTNPDSLIMMGKGDAIVRDSTYNLVLNTYAGKKAHKAQFDLPTNTPMTKVFDSSNVPGAQYRLELINVSVPLWFLWFNNLTMTGPALEITLGDCPALVPAFFGGNLKGTLRLPAPWGKSEPSGEIPPIVLGNLTLRTSQERPVWWAAYLWGEETDLTILGPTQMVELFVWGGRARLIGDEGTYNAKTTATTLSVGNANTLRPAKLIVRNAEVVSGKPSKGYEYWPLIRGQIIAVGGGVAEIENCKLAPVTLITKGQGRITLTNVEKSGEIKTFQEGGPIEFR